MAARFCTYFKLQKRSSSFDSPPFTFCMVDAVEQRLKHEKVEFLFAGPAGPSMEPLSYYLKLL
jgi:hypothetical protein